LEGMTAGAKETCPPSDKVGRAIHSEVKNREQIMKKNQNLRLLTHSCAWCIGWFVPVLLAVGCAGPRPLRGGHALTRGPVAQNLVQGDNPAQATRQSQETVRVRTYTLPAGSRVEGAAGGMGWDRTDLGREELRGLALQQSNGPTMIVLAAPTPVVEREETRANTELGAAQKDTARELGAKLSSLKGIVWVGLALFIFGLASLVWPPLKLIIGSVTTSAAIVLGGLALMILPTLIVGNELLILAGVALAVGAWSLAHRHGKLRGLVDANKNGIDDRLESKSSAYSSSSS
jgi:hypothetical protein